METSIGPNEGNSSSKDESSVPSSIPSVRKFKETPIDGLDSKFNFFLAQIVHQISVNFIQLRTHFTHFWIMLKYTLNDQLSNFESSPPMGGPVTEEIISPQKSKPPPSRNHSQKSIKTSPPKPSEFLKQQSTERLKPSGIGPQANKCRDKVIYESRILLYLLTLRWNEETYVLFKVFFKWRKT